jgi:hypothetical protein
MPVIRLNPGLMMLSNTPSRTLSMNRNVKLEAAPCHSSIVDQQTTVVERYLLRGNLTKLMELGKLAMM